MSNVYSQNLSDKTGFLLMEKSKPNLTSSITSLSVIVPAFNEATNLPVLLDKLLKILGKSSLTFEIIVVDDHSTDDTHTVLKPYLHSPKISLVSNQVKLGKSLAVLSGYSHARGEYIALLDADFLDCSDSIVALYQLSKMGYATTQPSKKWYQPRLSITPIRGPKIFPRHIFEHISPDNLNSWNIESELINTAKGLGLSHHSVVCNLAHKSRPKPLLTRLSRIAGTWATKLRHALTKPIYTHTPAVSQIMHGAGVTYKRQRYITHSTLPHQLSALKTFQPWQALLIVLLVVGLGFGLLTNTIPTLIILTSVLSVIYLLDVIFNLYVTLKSLHFPPEITFPLAIIAKLKDRELPIYSILVPLYREAHVLPQFITSMAKLDYPTHKLDILLLLEEGDDDTIATAKQLNLPKHYRLIIVPHSNPKTKPKACNYGLSLVRGEYVVIYDAEDRPDPLQLKKAYLALRRDDRLGCVQAKLNYFNPKDNLLTRFFTAEYSLWFDVILPGLQSINTSIPLGGTSNHFRTSLLRELHGWDAFNVTEDADLGTRLFNAGYQTAIIDSTTLEEANSNWHNWVRQRSRWLKGYMQTYLVHMRHPLKLLKTQGVHALLFNLVVGGKISFILINPFLWLMTISYFVLYAQLGEFIESIYPTTVFYIAVTSLLFGNFIALYNYMIGCTKRGHWELIKYVYLIPFYWLAISYAAVVALFQLIAKPHYWEKTVHGLDLVKANLLQDKQSKSKQSSLKRARYMQALVDRGTNLFNAGGVMVLANVFANFMNFLYNAYLSRRLDLAAFGDIALFGSFLYLSSIPISGLSRTFTHTTGYLMGKYNQVVKSVWSKYQHSLLLYGAIASLAWLIISPTIQSFFKIESMLPLLIFAPIWLIRLVGSGNSGYLSGNMVFGIMALSVITESVVKFGTTIFLVGIDQKHLVYVAVLVALLVSVAIEWLYIRRVKPLKKDSLISQNEVRLSKKFYFTSVVTTLIGITYLTLDVMLAKHFLSPSEAGAYSYLSLAGKMVFFLGGMFSQFLIPYVSRDIGAGGSGKRSFVRIVGLVGLANLSAVVAFGFLGHYTAPLLWGSNAQLIIPHLPLYSVSMALFSMSSLIIAYQQLRRRYLFTLVGFGLSLLQVVGMLLVHDSIQSLVLVVAIASMVTLIVLSLMMRYYGFFRDSYTAFIDFIGLFNNIPRIPRLPGGKLRILIFNWRDLRHKWAGGAEVYLHELSKRWVEMGHEVTIFSGNDGHSARFEKHQGVRLVRRGGFYLVYFWAFMYYFFRLRGRYDVIIDSENGLPFFTPLYVKEPVFLLIHHVHQEVFRKSLIPPFSWLAQFLEKRIMPLVYRNTEVITVSPSSQDEILAHKLTTKTPHIVYNGVDLDKFVPGAKSANPMILYLGRLTTAKSIHVLIQAVAKLKDDYPDLECVIAGDGPMRHKLEKIVKNIKLQDTVRFTGRISESEKIKLYQQAWVFVNPSLLEGWGITTIEAGACGTPVVASDVAGLRDAVSDTHSGILVPYGKVDCFVIAIKALLDNKNTRSRMSRSSRRWAAKFSWVKSAKNSINVLTKKSV